MTCLEIRVSMGEDGRTAERTLYIDGVRRCDLSYLDTIDLVSDVLYRLKESGRGDVHDLAEGISLSHVEAVEFAKHATSTLRW